MAVNKLKKYLQDVAQNASTRHAHLTDPDKSMRKAKLTKKQREMVLYGDIDAIQKEIGSKTSVMVVTATTGHFKK